MNIATTSFRLAVGQASSFGLAPAPGMIWTARDAGQDVREATHAWYGEATAYARTSSHAQFLAKLSQWGLDVWRRTVPHQHRRTSNYGTPREAHGLC
jgi:hypothetical protein